MLNALFTYQGLSLSALEIAELACAIEIERCGKPIGKQDQYVAALGGIRDIRFGPGDAIAAMELRLSTAELRAFQQHIMLFYTGVTRSADPILAEQSADIKANRSRFDFLRDLAGVAVDRLRDGDVAAVGTALRAGWEAKRRLASGVSDAWIDAAVSRALGAGALGATLTDADGGGFLLVICPIERHRAVREALTGMREMPVKLDRLGSRVLLNVLRDI